MACSHLARLTILAAWAVLVPAALAPPAEAGGREEYVAGLLALKERAAMRAVVHLSAAIESGDLTPPQLSDAFYFRAYALGRVERGDLALADLGRALTVGPENVKALRLRCRTLTLAGDTEKAAADCNMAVLLAPEDWRTWFTRGLLHDHRNDRALAKGDLAAAQARMPEGADELPAVRKPLQDYGLIPGDPPPVQVPAPDMGD